LFVAGAFLVGLAGVAQADDEGPNFTFGASASFTFDANDPKGPAGLNGATYASQEQDESFNIDLVQIGVNGQRGRVGYGAKVDLGDLAALAGDSSDGDIALQEAYLTYDADGLGAMAGRFGTPIGYEVLEPWGNANISRSWAWQAQPINHDGITINGSADVVDIMVGVVNNFSVSESGADPNNPSAMNDGDDEKGIIASLGAGLSDELNLYVAGIFTEENDTNDVTLINAIVSGAIDAGGSGLRYAVEGNYKENDPKSSTGNPTQELWNVGVYAGTDIGPAAVDLRWDYTDDEGVVFGQNTEVWSITLTGSVALADGVDFRLEYRHDDADASIFNDNASTDDTIDTVQFQVVWHPEG